MNHEEALAVTAAYHAGTLDREQVRSFHAHLKVCEACQAGMRVRGLARFRPAKGPMVAPGTELHQKMAQNRKRLVQILLIFALTALLLRLLK